MLDALPELGSYEIRLSHRDLVQAAVASLYLTKELLPSCMQLLQTAAAASPAHLDARAKIWPSIRAGLVGLGVSSKVLHGFLST